jgi:hypothetical protein
MLVHLEARTNAWYQGRRTTAEGKEPVGISPGWDTVACSEYILL